MIYLVATLSISVSATITEYDLTYDDIGNMQQGFDQHLEYNEFNQLTKVRENNETGDIIVEYTYDHEGQRTKKYEPQIPQTTYYIDDDFIQIVNDTGTFLEVYYHDGETLVGRKDHNGKKFFYHPDHLDSTSIVTDESGDVVEESTYKPYGLTIDGGNDRFLFTGKELDHEVGLYYYGARYYDPFFRHFTQPDQNIPEQYNPQDLNRYAYVRNNPYKYVDPTGEVPTLALLLISGFAIGFIGTLGTQFTEKGTEGLDYSQAFINGLAVGVGAVAGFGLEGVALAIAEPAITVTSQIVSDKIDEYQESENQQNNPQNTKETTINNVPTSPDYNLNTKQNLVGENENQGQKSDEEGILKKVSKDEDIFSSKPPPAKVNGGGTKSKGSYSGGGYTGSSGYSGHGGGGSGSSGSGSGGDGGDKSKGKGGK